jgi:hypothetical protein
VVQEHRVYLAVMAEVLELMEELQWLTLEVAVVVVGVQLEHQLQELLEL